jgi:hypothetical protein
VSGLVGRKGRLITDIEMHLPAMNTTLSLRLPRCRRGVMMGALFGSGTFLSSMVGSSN